MLFILVYPIVYPDCHRLLTTLSGGRGVSILVMPLGIVSKNGLSTHFGASDLGVPRTYIILIS